MLRPTPPIIPRSEEKLLRPLPLGAAGRLGGTGAAGALPGEEPGRTGGTVRVAPEGRRGIDCCRVRATREARDDGAVGGPGAAAGAGAGAARADDAAAPRNRDTSERDAGLRGSAARAATTAALTAAPPAAGGNASEGAAPGRLAAWRSFACRNGVSGSVAPSLVPALFPRGESIMAPAGCCGETETTAAGEKFLIGEDATTGGGSARAGCCTT